MITKKALFVIFLFFSLVLPLSFIRASEPIKILIVPGHDNQIWGAQYGNIKEADMNLAVANQIYDALNKDKRFKVWITRDEQGYTKEFADYFSLHEQDIISFEENAKKKIQEEIKNGTFVEKVDVQHAVANKNMAVKLYGINKWADENKIDAMIHIHFNDYPRKNAWTVGKYKGFTVYMPEAQITTSKESVPLAKKIFAQLSKKYLPSTYVKEMGGLVPDQTLIALGSHDTLLGSVRSVLVEYGYIYQKIFRTWPLRKIAYKNMANLTVAGIKNYFFGK